MKKQATPQATSSPTGRNPRLLWTPERQVTWERMRAENHPWWVLAKRNADFTGTSAQRYGDRGQWAVFLYQVTGDQTYAEKALTVLRKQFANTAKKGANFTREYGAEYVIWYDWLYPAMTVEDRSAFIETLNRWAVEATTSASNPPFPIRVVDSDQTIGNFFQLAFLALATAPENPRAEEFLNRDYVGGLVATAVDRLTLRNAIKQYVVELADGGEWPEGTEYNMGTLKLLLMGVEGVRTATGVDHFPEVTALLPKLALSQIYEVTSDLNSVFQWGDTEHPRSPHLSKRVTLLGMLAGLISGSGNPGAYAHDLLEQFVTRYGATGYLSAEPAFRILYFYDPYAPRAALNALPPHFYARGQGLHFFRDGWSSTDSLLGIHLPPRPPGVDHQVKYFGDFQLYRRGEWTITHPLGYAGPPNGGEGTNTMLISGLSSMDEVKGTVAVEAGADGRYLYTAGTNSGQYYRQPYYRAPRSFLNEWTRNFLCLPSKDKKCNTILIHDRVNAGPVLDLDRYRAADQARIKEALARKQWTLHAPVSPTLTLEAIAWKTTGGQQVRVSTLLPVQQRREIIDEDATWPDTSVRQAEQKWGVRVMPLVDQEWDTFLNVVQVYDEAAPTVTLTRTLAGEAEGALIQRSGQPDSLALFSAIPSARVLTAGYTVQWTASTDSTEVYFADLDPGKTWAVRIDERPSVALSVSDQGLGRLTVSGAGTHSVRLEILQEGAMTKQEAIETINYVRGILMRLSTLIQYIETKQPIQDTLSKLNDVEEILGLNEDVDEEE